MLNLYNLPSDLQHRYTKLSQEYKSFAADLRDYRLSKIPRYVSVPQYIDEIGVQMDYDDMKEMAEIARGISLRQMNPIRTGTTPIGTLYCFLEEILDQAFEVMALPEDDEE